MTQIPESARRRMQTWSAGEHPDADLLNGFTAHALAPAERERVIAHLAACVSCREIVSLALSETADAEVIAPSSHGLFRWPNLRWAAVAASVVVVGAAVSVLVPRRPVAPTAAEKTSQVFQDGDANPRVAKVQNSAAQQQNAQPATDEVKTKTDRSAVAENRAKAEHRSANSLPAIAALDAAADHKEKARSEVAKAPAPMAAPAARDAVALADKPVGAVIAGKVTDPSGAAVSNALVKITNANTNESAAARTDASGNYKFDAVKPGPYQVEAAAAGMQKTRTAQLEAKGNVEQDLTVRPSAMAETVTVTGESAAVPGTAGGVMGGTLQSKAAPQPVAPPPPPSRSAPADLMQTPRQKAPERQPMGVMKKSEAGAIVKWRVSAKGAIERSADSKSWEPVEVDPGVTFRAISSNDGDIWAGGTAGALFHSSDAGRTWSRVKVGSDGMWVSDAITGVNFPTSRIGYVNTASGAVWATQDAGRTWQRRQ